MAGSPDLDIWAHARESGFVITSKDNDFQQLSFVYGAPPKVIWIRRGNCSVSEIEEVLRRNAEQIEAFGVDAESSYLVL